MNFKATLVLIILVATGGYLWWITEARLGPRPVVDDDRRPSPPAAQPIFEEAPEAENITAIRIEIPGRDAMTFERVSEVDWRMTAPVEADCEAYMLNGLARKCLALRSQGRSSATDADAGLAPAQAVFTFAMDQGREYIFEIGGNVGISNDIYVRVSAPDVPRQLHEISNNFKAEIERRPADYRRRTLFNTGRAATLGLELTHEGTEYRLGRARPTDPWMFEKPQRTYADRSRISDLVSALTTLRASEFIDENVDDLARYGLDQPFLTLRIEFEEELEATASEEADDGPPPPPEVRRDEFTMHVGGYADLARTSRYVKLARRDWVASVPVNALDKLIPNFTEWRDSRVAPFEVADVTGLEITHDGLTRALERADDGSWSGGDDLAHTDVDAVLQLVEAIVSLRAIDYIDNPEDKLAEFGLSEPRTRIIVRRMADSPPFELHVGEHTPSGRNAYLAVVGQPSVFVVAAAQADRVAITPLALRSPQVFDVEVFDVTQIEQRVGQRRRVVAREDDRWTLREPSDADVDDQAVESLWLDLGRLRGVRVVDKGNFERYGLDQPAAEFSFDLLVRTVNPESSTAHEHPAHNASHEHGEPADTENQQDDSPPDEQDAPSEMDVTAHENTPSTSVQVALTERQLMTHTLRLGFAGENAYAVRDNEPFIFELDATLPPVLTAELIDRRVWRENPDALTYIAIRHGGEDELAFDRSSGDWKYVVDPYVRLSQKAIDELLGEVARLRAVSFPVWSGGDPATVEPVGMRIELRTSETTHTLMIAAEGEVTRRPAFWVERGRLLELDLSALTTLSRPLDAYIVE